jgi:hypothetical protein
LRNSENAPGKKTYSFLLSGSLPSVGREENAKASFRSNADDIGLDWVSFGERQTVLTKQEFAHVRRLPAIHPRNSGGASGATAQPSSPIASMAPAPPRGPRCSSSQRAAAAGRSRQGPAGHLHLRHRAGVRVHAAAGVQAAQAPEVRRQGRPAGEHLRRLARDPLPPRHRNLRPRVTNRCLSLSSPTYLLPNSHEQAEFGAYNYFSNHKTGLTGATLITASLVVGNIGRSRESCSFFLSLPSRPCLLSCKMTLLRCQLKLRQ